MALPNEPISRTEQYLQNIATGEGELPEVPLSRKEQYLQKIATGEGDVPEQPLSRIEQYLAYIAEHGGGGGGTIEPITITANGTYAATEEVDGYAPITVSVNLPDAEDYGF